MDLSFSFYMPTRIIFGPGRLSELARTPHLPGRKALVVIGAGGAMRRNGYLDSVLETLTQRGMESVVYDRILPNPVSDHVDEGAAVARQEGCDLVIGLGGGSSIDSAKSIAVMAKNPGRYWDYIGSGSGGRKAPVNGALPIVAIPTTAGTGTEADPWTVITKTETREKTGLGNDSTYPVLSIVDPELTLSLPPAITAHTGMDAFFHAVEAYLATCHQPASDHLALEAVGLITRYLPVAVRDGSNGKARTMLAWASTEAGICESLSACISHHSIEHALSAFHPELAHGAGLTALSVSYFTYLAERVPERFPALARAMGVAVDSLSEKEKPFTFITALTRLITDSGLRPGGLKSYGIKKEKLRELAENSFYTMGGLYRVTPFSLTVDDVVNILENAFE